MDRLITAVGLDSSKIPVAGGTPIVIVQRPAAKRRGASWARRRHDRVRHHGSRDRTVGASAMPAARQRCSRSRTEIRARLTTCFRPCCLEDGASCSRFWMRRPTIRESPSSIRGISRRQVLVPGAASAHYIDAGYLVYAASGTLFAVRFNLDRLRVEGDPLTLANGVLMGTAAGAYYAVSQAGTLAYVPATATPDPPRTLVWLDRKGTETPLNAPPRPYRTVRLSPDGHRIAVAINDQRARRVDLGPATSDAHPDHH